MPWEIASLRAVACSSGRRLWAIVTSSFARSALVWTGCWTQVGPRAGRTRGPVKELRHQGYQRSGRRARSGVAFQVCLANARGTCVGCGLAGQLANGRPAQPSATGLCHVCSSFANLDYPAGAWGLGRLVAGLGAMVDPRQAANAKRLCFGEAPALGGRRGPPVRDITPFR